MIVDENNIRGSVLKLALPSVAEQTLIMIVGVVSTIFVGHISKEAISAVGIINIQIGFIIALFVALSTGSTVMVARLIGEKKIDDAKDILRQSTVLGFVASLIICLTCFALAVPLISLIFGSADLEIIHLADLYFKINLITLPLGLINIIISGSLRGAGDTKTPMLIAALVNVMNVILSIVLIFGFGNFKGLGFTGAAMSVAISRGTGGVLSIIALYMPRNIIRLNIFHKFKVRTSLIKRILKVGIPAAMEQIVMQGGFLVLQVVIVGMGTVPIAVYQVAMSINSVCYMPLWGFGMAATTMVGQSLGARKPDLAEKSGWDTSKITILVSTVMSLVLFISSKQLVGLYSNDPEILKIGAVSIKIFSISQPFIAVVIVLSGALRGAGDIMYVMLTSFVGIWAFRILLTVSLTYFFGLGLMGVWIAMLADFSIRSGMYAARFKKGRWKEIIL